MDSEFRSIICANKLPTKISERTILNWFLETGAIVSAAAASALELGAGFRLVTAPQVIKRHIVRQLPAQLWRHSCQRYFVSAHYFKR